MTKYSVASTRGRTQRPEQTHAVWRGIGCLLMIIVPVISWFLAAETVRWGVEHRWPLPYQLMGYPVMPDILWKVPGLVPGLVFIQDQQNLYATIAIAVAFVVIAGGLISYFYSLIYRIAGPSRYGPLDSPPPNIRVGRYKR